MLISSTAAAEPDANYDPRNTGVMSGWDATQPFDLLQYVYYNHTVYQSLVAHTSIANSNKFTVTVSTGTPCVVTWSSAHGLYNGALVVLSSATALPSGLLIGGSYYVTVTSSTTCTLSSSRWGSTIDTTGALGTVSGVITTTTTQPDLSLIGSNPTWQEIGPTNRWAMFDTYINTATKCNGNLAVTVAPGICNGVAVLDLSGVSAVTVSMPAAGFSQEQKLDDAIITDWYSYFFEPFDLKTDLIFGPMPSYATAQVTVTAVADDGGVVSIGAVMFGTVTELGEVEYGATSGITDYSRKETNDFGVTTLVERGYAKDVSYQLSIPHTQLRRVFSTLARLRATPAVYIGSDDYNLTPLTAFGWVNDFSVNVQYPTYSSVSVEVKGLT